jgi:hypothetical protein
MSAPCSLSEKRSRVLVDFPDAIGDSVGGERPGGQPESPAKISLKKDLAAREVSSIVSPPYGKDFLA